MDADESVKQELENSKTELGICSKYPCNYICPMCGSKVPFFLQRSSRSPIVKCPVCGAIIKKSEIPKESIITAPKAYDMIGKTSIEEIVDVALKEQEEQEHVEEQESIEERVTMEHEPRHEKHKRKKGIITESLFYKPKTPCEILAEILDEFAFINEDFKTFIMRRCERRGFLHPIELLTLLQRMKSGIRTKDEAGIIAEEYAVALQRELEKAQREGMNYPYIPNLYVPENVPTTDPYVQRLLQILPPNLQPEQYRVQPSTQQYTQYNYTKPSSQYSYSQYSKQTQQPIVLQPPQLNIAPLVELFKTTQQSQIQQQQQQMQLLMQMFQTQQQLTVQSIQTALDSSMKSIGEGLKALSEAIKELKTQSNQQQGTQLTPEILNLIKESAESKAQVQFYQKLMELQQKHTEEMQKVVSEFMGKIEEIMKKTVSMPTGEYKSDEAKLVAQAFSQVAQVGHRLVDALDKRQPIKIIVEALPYLTGSGKPKPKKYKEVETGAEIIKELEEEGLVEE